MATEVAEAQEKTLIELLTTKERTFVHSILDTQNNKSIGIKGQEAGYGETYGYELYRKDHIQAAIDEEIARDEHELRIHRIRVKKRLAEDAESRKLETSDTHKAAELFLKSQGDIASGGQVNVTNVQANGGKQSSFAERVRSGSQERFETIVESSGGGIGGEDAEE